MRKMLPILLCMMVVFLAAGFAQEKTDSATIAAIRDEGLNRSQVMDILSTLTDVYGPRLAWSPEYMQAAKWAEQQMKDWGLSNVHLEEGEPRGREWTLNTYSANVLAKQNFPLISYPAAWSPAVNKTAELVYMDADSESALGAYKGKLKGKFVMLSSPREVTAHFEPEATRLADSTLLKMANADDPANRPRRGYRRGDEWRKRAMLDYQKRKMAEEEGAAGFVTISYRGDGGNVFVASASVTSHPDTPWTSRKSSYNPDAPKILPQIVVGTEHYNRLVRMIQKGETPKLQVNLDCKFGKVNPIYNIIAEIPGTDLADEIVMVGGHFDSWHGGTGASDDATGTAASMEAMRIIKTLGLKPRRTIRIGLWDSEEQGLNGSEAYVKAHFGSRGEATEGGDRPVNYLPDAEKFSVYFNHDNGTGKFRGVYMQGNEAVRPIFRAWLNDFDDLGATTLTLSNTGGTDHLSFDAIGLPGFQFIQDPIEYGTRVHHATMDVFDRVQADDMKQAAVIMAAFAYNAAMRDEKFPRKEMPKPRQMPGSN